MLNPHVALGDRSNVGRKKPRLLYKSTLNSYSLLTMILFAVFLLNDVIGLNHELELARKPLNELRRRAMAMLETNSIDVDFNVDSTVFSIPSSNEEMVNKASGMDEYLYQGDIALTRRDVERRLRAVRRRRLAIHDPKTWPDSKWPRGIVPFYLDNSLPTRTRERLRLVMSYIERQTCIRFREDRWAKPTLRIFYGPGCWSFVGRYKHWETQDLSLGPNCDLHFGVLAHELLHALGLYHEQSRPDRDWHVYLNGFNIHKNDSLQFIKESKETSDDFGVPYDYGSVMHYSMDTYALNPSIPVLIPFQYQHRRTIGQRMKPSFYDINQINMLYQCSDNCRSRPGCAHGGVVSANSCYRCLCPHGLAGFYCTELEKPTYRNSECGGEFYAREEAQTIEGKVDTGVSAYDWLFEPETCWWRIRGPSGARIEVRFEEMVSYCETSCAFNSIEIKTDDLRKTGYRVCCHEDIYNSFKSNGTILIGASARLNTLYFKLTYRAVIPAPDTNN